MSAPPQQPTIPSVENQGPDWKRQLTERLDAYRSKHPETTLPSTSIADRFADSRASKIARSVASRYAAVPTYREVLQAEQQATLEAQVALATQIAEEKSIREKLASEQLAAQQRQVDPEPLSSTNLAAEPPSVEPPPSMPRDRSGTAVLPQFAARSGEMHVHQSIPEPEPSLEDLWASALVEPRSLLPSKLIEFPRELVSPRRARPRLPEPPEPSQLRIFEVRPELEASSAATQNEIAETPASASPLEADSSSSAAAITGAPSAALRNPSPSHDPAMDALRSPVSIPARSTTVAERSFHSSSARAFQGLEWASISLDREAFAPARKQETVAAEYVPFLVEPASVDRRLMALAVDFAAVTAGFLGFLLVFAASTPHLPGGLTAAALGGVVYLALWVLYQMLFFSLSGATAGMLYARIALCTFDDQNPTREAMRRRLAAWWLSCLPLGIGFLWCFVDEDNLSWHDRITRMYQRSY